MFNLMKKAYFVKGVLVVIFLLGQFALAADQAIRINDPWIREAPPNVKVLAAYMTIENLSSQSQILTSVTSSVFADVMIHKTVTRDNGMMGMVHESQLVIKAQNKVILAPGGYHLMLMMPKKTVVAGDKVDLILKFAEGKEMAIEVPVRKFSKSLDAQ